MQSKPQPIHTVTERPYEPEYSKTALALMNIPEPIMQANRRLIASNKPIVGCR